jgi:long-chain acyl-CoA synthetase
MSDRPPPTFPCRAEALIDWGAAARPDHVAIRHGARAWTYAELRRERDRRAGLLVEAGLRAGHIVVTTEPITDELTITFFACAQAGVVFFHLSQQLAPAEHVALAAQASPTLAFTAGGSPGTSPLAPRSLPIALPGSPSAEAVAEAARRSAAGTAADPAAIRSTSGTTGQRPKLVVRPHALLTWQCAVPAPYETPDDIFCLPNRHYFMPNDTCRVLGLGATILFPVETALDRVEAEWAEAGTTLLYTVPALVTALAARAQPVPPGLRLHAIRVTAAALPLEDRRAIEARYGARIVVEYASTEAGYMLTAADPATPPGSIGRPYEGIEARLVDERGEDVPPGAAGELIIRSPGLMLGYLGQPEATAEVLRDGWYHTGDLARRDEAGCYWLEGRRALRINVGGYKVAPEEIEAVLLQHPAVREVVVVAAPDRLRGEVPRAVIVPEGQPPTPGELRRFCAAHLARYKIPRRIEFRDELPRSPLGKVLRNRL